MKHRSHTFSPSREVLLSIKTKFLAYAAENPGFRMMSMGELHALLSSGEKAILRDLRMIDPLRYGFKGEYFGNGRVPNDLVQCANVRDGSMQFLPRVVYAAFLGMNVALYQQTGKRLFILSGYRSAAYQSILFLGYYLENDLDLKKTCSRVALPGWSEHGAPKQQAVDLDVEGHENGTNFDHTPEYEWLLANASKFGFHLSYPKHNELGVMFEPWHWAYHRK